MNNLDISIGTLPAVDTQVNNPRLRNAFVNQNQHIQLLPNIEEVVEVIGAQTILQSTFNDRLFIATDNDLYYYENGNLVEVSTFSKSIYPVRMAENAQGQLVLVNGNNAWVYNQPTNVFFQLGIANGFDLTNPTDVTTLNTFLVVVGGSQKRWIVSNANDATNWQANEIVETDSRMGNLIGVETLSNNLFILGTGGVERWLPSVERTPSSFPFSKDPSYQDEYGCAATASVISKNNELYYLSNNGQIRRMSPYGRETITNDGIENIISNYTNLTDARGSYYYHKGHWFYQLSFPDNDNAFVFSSKSKKWSESDFIFYSSDSDKIVNSQGLYSLSSSYNNSYWSVVFQTTYFMPKTPHDTLRASLNTIVLELTQGKNETNDKQVARVQLSKDNVLFGNEVEKLFSNVGERLYQLRWYLNYANNGFCIRFTLKVKTDITITKCLVNVR